MNREPIPAPNNGLRAHGAYVHGPKRRGCGWKMPKPAPDPIEEVAAAAVRLLRKRSRKR